MRRNFSLAEMLTQWCNNINHGSDEELVVIQYGAELFLDNLLRILALIIFGGIVGKLYETTMVLVIFCSIRSQAGGFHARTGWGCGTFMAAVCIISLLGSENMAIPLWWVMILYVISICIVMFFVPRTVNRSCFSPKAVVRKKRNTIVLISIFVVAACLEESLRNVICYPLFLEVATLIPNNKNHMEE